VAINASRTRDFFRTHAANAEFDKPSTERKLDQDAGHMATSFLHSGDSILESAAKKWAHARGYHIVLMPSGHIIE
jgi:hypothetical protein